MSKELSLQETGAMLLAAEKIVLCTHVSPDGDTLGSTLGLARFLLAQGKQVTVFCDDVINKSFSFFPGIELCERPVEGSKLQTDLLVVIDASSFDRIGLVSEVVEAKILLNIDHHISNERFADYLYLDAKAAAVGEVMCDLFMAMQWPFDKEIATCFTQQSAQTAAPSAMPTLRRKLCVMLPSCWNTACSLTKSAMHWTCAPVIR